MELFKSRRFWSAVVGIVMMVAVNFLPQLAQNADTLTTAILIVVGLLIGGYSAEDVMLARGGVTSIEGWFDEEEEPAAG
jgi:sugar phosphate permease